MSGPEAKIEREVCEQAAAMGIPNAKMRARNWPDRLFLVPGGKPLFIEFKAPGKELRPGQMIKIELARSMGYLVDVHSSVEDALVVLASTQRTWALQPRSVVQTHPDEVLKVLEARSTQRQARRKVKR